MTEQTAQIIELYPKNAPIKCSFCGRDLVHGKDVFLEGTNGHAICIKPCAANAKKLIDSEDVQ